MRNTALWCNGSTTVFGSVRAGSSPARVTKDLDKKENVLSVVIGCFCMYAIKQ